MTVTGCLLLVPVFQCQSRARLEQQENKDSEYSGDSPDLASRFVMGLKKTFRRGGRPRPVQDLPGARERKEQQQERTLSQAICDGDVDVLRALLRAGAAGKLDAPDPSHYMKTPVHIAVALGAEAMVKELLGAGASPLVPAANGVNAVEEAVHLGLAGIVGLMLAGGIDPDYADPTYQVPLLHRAAVHGHLSVVRLLVDSGCDVHRTVPGTCKNALHAAAQQGHANVVALLIRAGCRPDSRTQHGHTPTHLAAQYGHVHVLRVLAHAGCNVDAKTVDGLTPLMMAAWKGHVGCVDYLIDFAGADVQATEKHGLTALQLSNKRGHCVISSRLLARRCHGPSCTPMLDMFAELGIVSL